MILIYDFFLGIILIVNDYVIKKLLVKELSELVKSNILSSVEINCYLLKENVFVGFYIIKDMLVIFDSDEFNYFVLKKGNIIYKFNLKK